MLRTVAILLLSAALIFSLGCSGGTDNTSAPLAPDTLAERATSLQSHNLLGLWQFTANPDAQTLDFTQLRIADLHLNALPFLEPPALLFLSLESLEFNGNIIEAGIGLRHPFLGLTEFSGFDVCGILISDGSIGGFDNPDLLMPGPDDLHLANADGFTRWWNPSEFPSNGTIFGYTDGLLGAPYSVADFSATLNGYKYFCDDLDDPDDPVSDVPVDSRGLFSAGQKNVRHYTIDLGTAGLVFNYAVDASWQFPQGDPPYSAPDDFAPEANRPEAWNIAVTILDDTLYNDGVELGGDLSLQIDVYDWFDAGLNLVSAESAGSFTSVTDVGPTGGGEGYSTYIIDIVDATPVTAGEIDIFLTIECEAEGYGGLLPGEKQAAYFWTSAPVDDEAPVVNEYPPEWSCFQYNAANIGRNPNIQNFDHTNYSQTWYTPLSSAYKMPGPAITENYVYTVSLGGAYSTSSNHFLYCLDIVDGAVVWYQNINPTNDYGRGMTGAVWYDDGADGRIVVGGDRVWCFDALTGAIEWEYGEPLTSWMRHNPRFYNDRVYIAFGGTMVCLDAYTGAEIWISVGSLTSFETCPAIFDGKIYFANAVYFTCMDTDDGSIIWQTPSTEGQSHWDAPLVVNGRVYLATYNEGLRCLDAETGTLYWTYDEDSDAYITGLAYWVDPSDDHVVIYQGSAFSTSGCLAIKDMGSAPSKMWESAAAYYDASPVYNEGVVYIGNTSGTLYGFDCETGSIVFTQAIQGGIRNAIGFAFGKMIVPANGGIYCFESN